MRWVTAAAAATASAAATAAAALVAGRKLSDMSVRPRGPDPATATGLRVHNVGEDKVALTRSVETARSGRYALEWPAGHAVVGDVMETTAQTVVRRLERVTDGRLTAGTRVEFTPRVLTGNPESALGLPFSQTWAPGELGPMPSWYLPGVRDLCVVAVHGLGADRVQTLPAYAPLAALKLPVLSASYRGDEGAPRSPDGLAHFGETEWCDVEAAVRLALRSGARRVVLYGWSIGATMALRTLSRSAWSDTVCGLVLDSPILDWRGTVSRLATRRGVPAPLAALGVRAAQGRSGIDTDEFARLALGEELRVPTLIVHGPGDTLAPWQASVRLARRRAELVTLHEVPQAEHAAMWNADPQGYDEALRRFLTPLL